MPLNPYTAKLLKRVRDLPLAEIRDLMARLKYVEHWIYTNEGNQHVCEDAATRGEARCVGREVSCVAQIRQQLRIWTVTCEGEPIGSGPTLSVARDLAEAELELRGYVLPWRRND